MGTQATYRRLSAEEGAAYVEDLFGRELEPIAKALAADGATEEQARASAWIALPGLYAARLAKLGLARDGATELELFAGHAQRAHLVNEAMRHVRAELVQKNATAPSGRRLTFTKALRESRGWGRLAEINRALAEPGWPITTG